MSGITIGLCGPAGRSARCGKTTVAGMLRDRHGFEILSFATPVYDAARAIDPIIPIRCHHPHDLAEHCIAAGHPIVVARLSQVLGWVSTDEAKDAYPEYRRLLQRVGTEAGRDIHGADAWIDLWYRRQGVAADAWRSVVAPDVRFANEAKMIHQAGGLVIMVDRPGEYDPSRAAGHASELGIPEHMIDYTLKNDGTLADLSANVDRLMRHLHEDAA